MSTAYIETTIPSYYVARTSLNLIQASRQVSTRLWWDNGCSGFDLFTSTEVLNECGRGDETLAAQRLDLLRGIPVIKISENSIQLAAKLIAEGLVPAKVASDALHIALASVNEMNYLVTWNFKHISNPHLRDRLRKTIAAEGFNMPVMCCPEELNQNP